MTLDEVRQQLESYRRLVDDEARTLRDSYSALEKLRNFYLTFAGAELANVDMVIAEWALSDDEAVRFDALALIDEFRIVKATTALKNLASRLALSDAPGAPYELQKVTRIAAELTRN